MKFFPIFLHYTTAALRLSTCPHICRNNPKGLCMGKDDFPIAGFIVCPQPSLQHDIHFPFLLGAPFLFRQHILIFPAITCIDAEPTDQPNTSGQLLRLLPGLFFGKVNEIWCFQYRFPEHDRFPVLPINFIAVRLSVDETTT